MVSSEMDLVSLALILGWACSLLYTGGAPVATVYLVYTSGCLVCSLGPTVVPSAPLLGLSHGH